jgi:hypothetical protein
MNITEAMTEDGRWYFTITDLEGVQTVLFSEDIVGEKTALEIENARHVFSLQRFLSTEGEIVEMNHFPMISQEMEDSGMDVVDSLKFVVQTVFTLLATDIFNLDNADLTKLGQSLFETPQVLDESSDWPPIDPSWANQKISLKERVKRVWSTLTGGVFEMNSGKEH